MMDGIRAASTLCQFMMRGLLYLRYSNTMTSVATMTIVATEAAIGCKESIN